MKIIKQLQSRFPNWENFNNNLIRNYPCLVVGGTSAYIKMRNVDYLESQVLNLTIPSQNLYMCKEVVRHFFSITKVGGRIILMLSQSELESKLSNEPLPFHFTVLHHWLYPRRRKTDLKMRFPFLIQPVWTLRCMGYKFPQRFVCGDLKDNITFIRGLQSFCLERGRTLQIVLCDDVDDKTQNMLESGGVKYIGFNKFIKDNSLY